MAKLITRPGTIASKLAGLATAWLACAGGVMHLRNRILKLTCHCENIEINVVAPQQVTSCNCSVCRRYQTLWGYYKPDEVKIDVGSLGVSSYIWGDKELEFVHCKSCGCVTHYRTIAGTSDHKVAVNFRMAHEELISEISVRNFNGKELL